MEHLSIDTVLTLLGYGWKGVVSLAVFWAFNWQIQSWRSKRANGRYRNPGNPHNGIYRELDRTREEVRAECAALKQFVDGRLEELRRERDQKLDRLHDRMERVDDELRKETARLAARLAAIEGRIDMTRT